jgi:hypothetical protein
MVLHKCPRCLCEFNKKSHYECPINRKHKCDLHPSYITNNENNNLNTINNNLNINALNLILEEFKKVKEELKDVKEDNRQMKKQMKKMQIKHNTITEQTNITNNGSITKINNEGTINNTNNTVNIVAFGKENMDFVVEEIGKLCQGNKTISNFVDFVHFNKDKPENHNVYMPNRKNKNEVFVHNGVKWMLADKKNVVEHLIDKGIIYMEGKLDELKTIISESKLNAVERAIDAYNDNNHENNNEVTKKITKNIELILYNNKDLVMTSK